ncbi:MAG: aspartate carbamoyltransferase [bacterium]
MLKHVTKAQDFNPQLMEDIFSEADHMETIVRHGSSNILAGKILATLFYQPSTRTRLSFETAMLRLGGQVISTENAKEFSSAAKGESLQDTIRTVGYFANIIVLRHFESGSAEKAAMISHVPIINAGDGPGQHPTQALLDVYTIYKKFKKFEGLQVAMVGDLLNGRTVRSLCYLLSKFPIAKIWFVAPDVVRMRDDIKQHLREHKIPFEEESDLERVAQIVDVIYQTRIQQEYFGDRSDDYQRAVGKYIINGQLVQLMKPKAIIMHPLPRVGEITTEVDADHRAVYFKQVENGLHVRMALLNMLLNE